MEIRFTDKDLEFRDEIRSWIENEYPKHIKEKQEQGESLTKEEVTEFHKALSAKGWLGYNWPREYGGTGWTSTQIYIFQKEMGLAGCPSILPFGVSMVGPVIYTFGNDDQKKKYLPDILNFNTWWCQGYSEPGSGSDLASLSTKAVREGDHYVVNGSKTWTTLAQHADWIFNLVRTETTEKRQEGISFLLIDMNTPGVEVEPIITIDGRHEINTVFFSDVKVPVENLIGEEGKGWTYAKFLLAHERFGIAVVGAEIRELNKLKQIVSELDNPDLSRKVKDVEIDLAALEILGLRMLSDIEAKGHPGPESSILKIRGTEIQQRLTELFVEASGEYALIYPGPQGHNEQTLPAGPNHTAKSLSKYLNYRKTSIYGGSNEIQKNIISKMILGL